MSIALLHVLKHFHLVYFLFLKVMMSCKNPVHGLTYICKTLWSQHFSNLMQEIQFLGGSNLTHAHPNYFICMHFVLINTVWASSVFPLPSLSSTTFSHPPTLLHYTLSHPPTSYLCLSWLSQVKAWAFSTFCTIIFCTTSRAWTSMVQIVMIRWRLALVMSPSRR